MSLSDPTTTSSVAKRVEKALDDVDLGSKGTAASSEKNLFAKKEGVALETDVNPEENNYKLPNNGFKTSPRYYYILQVLRVWEKFKVPIFIMFSMGFVTLTISVCLIEFFPSADPSPSAYPKSSFAPSVASSVIPSLSSSVFNIDIVGVAGEVPSQDSIQVSTQVPTQVPSRVSSQTPTQVPLVSFAGKVLPKLMIVFGSVLMLPLILAGAALGIRIWNGGFEEDDYDYDYDYGIKTDEREKVQPYYDYVFDQHRTSPYQYGMSNERHSPHSALDQHHLSGRYEQTWKERRKDRKRGGESFGGSAGHGGDINSLGGDRAFGGSEGTLDAGIISFRST